MLYQFNNNNNNNKIIICVSAKAGSNTILKLFLKEYCVVGSDKNKNSIHYKAKKYQIKNIEQNSNLPVIKLKFVRNPYTRVVSAFIHLSNFNLSFYDFIIHLKKFLMNQNQQSIIVPNNDQRYKAHYIFQHDNINYEYICKIENLDKDINILNKLYNLDLNYDMKKLNSKNKKEIGKININYVYDKYGKYRQNITNNYKLFYNKEIKQLIYDIYKKDIDTYKYDYEII